MHTRDGVRLDADVYRPSQAGDHPVLLMRQPYGRRIASTVCYAHPAWYAAQGYLVVIQDVRGRGTSAGDADLFECEAEDGADTIEWAAALPGSTGRVGMYGFSYQGVTQLLAASTTPPALGAIAPAMIGWDLRNDWAWENGAFCLAANLGWSVQIAALTAKRAGDAAAFAELAEAASRLTLGRDVHARPDLLRRHAAYVPHHARWLDTDHADPYWRRISPAAHGHALTRHGPPALFVGGWFDTHLPGTIAAYRAYEDAGVAEAALVVGPWAHFPWGRRLGGLDFGDQAIGDIDHLQVAWFDRHLKGDAGSWGRRAPVRLFDIGARTWRDFGKWPAEATAWTMSSDGRAALDERAGKLGRDLSGPAAVPDHIVHDPWRPVETVGGAIGAVPGPVDRTATDARPDVLTYSSEPLGVPLALAGSPVVELDIGSDSVGFDVACTLSWLDGDGRARHLTDGYLHLAGQPAGPIRLMLRPLCATVPAGDRIRLSIAGACFPAFPVNPGDGSRPVDAPVVQAQVITLRVDAGASRLHLPLARLAQG